MCEAPPDDLVFPWKSNLKWSLLKMSQSPKPVESYVEPSKARVRLCIGVAYTCYPNTLKLRQEDPELEVSLGYTAGTLHRKQTNKKLKIREGWS